MLLPTPLFPGCKKHEPVTVAIRTVNGKKGPDVSLSAGDIPIAPGSKSSVQDEIKGIHEVLSSAGSFKKIEDYLYEADCPLPNAELAEEHFRARFGEDAPSGAAGFAACSVLNHDGLIGRAYDWKYDEAVTFVVHTPANGDRFASVSICSSPAGITKENIEAHAVHATLWAVLPFYAVDGMNENGVTCSVCVVYGKGSEDILWHGKEFCAVGAVRQVLDRARTAEEGADIIASEAWMPASVKLGGYSLHFMVTDEMHTFIVEDGVVIDITDDDIKAMTNFRLGSRSFLDETGHADVNKIATYDPYGTGVERYNELVDYAKFTSEETGLREWLTGFVFSDAYTEDVLTGSTPRPSEFAGIEISRDHFVKVNETEAIKAWFKSAEIHEKWVARERDGKFWQTVHSAVYDVAARMVSVVVQEGTAVHDFPIVREGGGSGTVKSVNEVEPDSKTGNVALTAHDIPYGGESASDVETAIELNTQAALDNAEAIDSLEEQVGEIKTTTYTKSEVDDKINQSAAHYLTKRTGTEGHYSYPQFATHADLAAAKAAHTEANPQFFYGVEGHTPDKNDYCVILADETHGGSTTRYMFVGKWGDTGYFRYQYTINETALTEKQWAAINSLTSVDEDGNLCFDGIPFINSSGELLFTEDDPIFTAWKNEVQIILGSGANVASGKYKQIAIGAHATANGQNSIALGSSEPGGRTNGPRAMAQNAIAIGAGAVASAVGAIQILAGTNNTSGTMQIGNKRVAFVSDIPISQADIDDYRYYKGHWDMSVTYKTGDIVRAERTVEGSTEKEVTYFKSLRDNNRANNPFSTPTYWSVTTDDEGLEKLTLFVKAAIATLTGADIPVSSTKAISIDAELNKKYEKPSGGIPLSDMEVDKFPPETVSDLNTRPEARGKAADAQDVFDKLAGKADNAKWVYALANIFDEITGEITKEQILLGVIGKFSDSNAVGYINGVKVDVTVGSHGGNAYFWQVKDDSPYHYFWYYKEEGIIVYNFGGEIQLGEGCLASVLTEDAKSALFALDSEGGPVEPKVADLFNVLKNKAFAGKLSGITAQDIIDFLKGLHEVKYGDYVEKGTVCLVLKKNWPDEKRDGVYECLTTATYNSGSMMPTHTPELWKRREGIERLTDLFGESNSQMVATIESRTPYALVEKTATDALDNRSVNKLTFTGGEGEAYTYALDSHLPTDTDGKARDFLVQIHCDKPVDITYATTFAVKGDLPSVDAAGDHLLAITELHGMWLIKKLALEDAQ